MARSKKHEAFVRSFAGYDELLAQQNGVCAICGHPPKTKRLNIDHDHKTMEVRGLLCHKCNRALPDWVTMKWLLDAAVYVGQHEKLHERP